MRNLIHLAITTAIAALMGSNQGCLPKLAPNADGMEKAFNAELAACSASTPNPQASCYCRQAVEEKWGVCDHPEWPRMGRCDYRCEGVK
jgi:hypothetical protein